MAPPGGTTMAPPGGTTMDPPEEPEPTPPPEEPSQPEEPEPAPPAEEEPEPAPPEEPTEQPTEQPADDCSDPDSPLADVVPDEVRSQDGVVNDADTIVFEGSYAVEEGACVVFEDADGTQGTVRDGENSEIAAGSVVVEVTADAQSVEGGDGALETEGLTAVTSEGITVQEETTGEETPQEPVVEEPEETPQEPVVEEPEETPQEPVVEEPAAEEPEETIDFGEDPSLPETGGLPMLPVGALILGCSLLGAKIIRRR